MQLRDTIPVAEYAKLKDRFTAKNFNADEITDLAIRGGVKYITITSKHHDGFCLFDSIMGYYSRPDLFPVDATYALIRSLSPHALISFKQGANGEEDFMAPERGGNARVGQQVEVAIIVYIKPLTISSRCSEMQKR